MSLISTFPCSKNLDSPTAASEILSLSHVWPRQGRCLCVLEQSRASSSIPSPGACWGTVYTQDYDPCSSPAWIFSITPLASGGAWDLRRGVSVPLLISRHCVSEIYIDEVFSYKHEAANLLKYVVNIMSI